MKQRIFILFSAGLCVLLTLAMTKSQIGNQSLYLPIILQPALPTATSTSTITLPPVFTPTFTVTLAPPTPTFTTLPPTPTFTLAPPTLPPTETQTSAICTCTGPDLDCSDFSTQDAAQSCFNHCVNLGYGDIYGLDQDNDGTVCESLP